MSATHELWVRMRCDVELDWCRGVGNTRSTHTLAGALAPLSSPLPRLGFTHDPMIGLLLPILLIYFFSPPSQIGRLSAPTRYKNQDPPWRVRVVQLRSQVVLHVTRHSIPGLSSRSSLNLCYVVSTLTIKTYSVGYVIGVCRNP